MRVSPAAAATPGLELVRSFAQLGHEDVQFASGKGANLGELTSAGLPVPDDFVVGLLPTPRSARSTACANGSHGCSTASTSRTPRTPPPGTQTWTLGPA